MFSGEELRALATLLMYVRVCVCVCVCVYMLYQERNRVHSQRFQ
jgi:hypothetical protein